MRFRNLSEEETSEFRQWARDNWTVGEDINPLWHPVVRAMCERMENEHSPHLGDEEVNPLWKNQVDSRVVSVEKFKELFNACVEDTP